MDLLTKTILSMAPKEEEIIVTGKTNLVVYSTCMNVIFNYLLLLRVQFIVQVFPSSWIDRLTQQVNLASLFSFLCGTV